MASLLTREEANQFVEDKLCISECKSLLQRREMYELLRRITRAMHEEAPFHNFFLMAETPSQRRRPSWEIVKNLMLTLMGGLCYTRNLFTFYLLRGLGYEVKTLVANVRGSPNPDHIMIVASNVQTSGDSFLVDVGLGFPNFEPLDLSFDKETPPIVQSYLTTKYTKYEGNISRLHQETENGELIYKSFWSCSMNECEPEDIEHYFDRVYEDPKVTVFHSVLRCVQYPGGKAIAIEVDGIKMESEEGQLVSYPLETGQTIEGRICDLFPTIPSHMVQAAVKNWRRLK